MFTELIGLQKTFPFGFSFEKLLCIGNAANNGQVLIDDLLNPGFKIKSSEIRILNDPFIFDNKPPEK